MKTHFAERPAFREPTGEERALLDRLMQGDFPGRDELARLLVNIFVRNIDADGGLELQTQVQGRAPVTKRIPIEAEARDEDGIAIHALLHVIEGKPVELELFREDGRNVKRLPDPSEFELVVLPPMPGEEPS